MKGLKNCPFCGGEPSMAIEDGHLFAACKNCGARGGRVWMPIILDDPATLSGVMSAAAAKWNERKGAED